MSWQHDKNFPVKELPAGQLPVLYIIATPIGHLNDLTPRARECLTQADLILCEDTRVTQKLLSHCQIHGKRLLACREKDWALERLASLIQGKTIALVVDSGTPALSDPGSHLIRRAAQIASHRLVPVPGASALTAALSVSGMGADGFVFLGFLPKSRNKINRQIAAALAASDTVVFYESPHRILATLELLATMQPGAPIVLCRELTKWHEEILRGTAREIYKELQGRPRILGEITAVLERPG